MMVMMSQAMTEATAAETKQGTIWTETIQRNRTPTPIAAETIDAVVMAMKARDITTLRFLIRRFINTKIMKKNDGRDERLCFFDRW